jgi:S1-C subfamily serine protease
MNNPHVTPMIKRFTFTTSILFVVAIIMPFNRVLLTPTAVVAQTQQINSPSHGTNSSSSNPLSLNTIFKQTENSVVNITSKTLTAGLSNPVNQTTNTSTLGSGFVYDKQGHILTNSHAPIIAIRERQTCFVF